MGFTVTYADPNGGANIVATGIHSIDIAPNMVRQEDQPGYRPQSIRCNGGIGGGGISGAGSFWIPIADVVSITVAEA
jgi:hypothetical protein